MLKMDPDHVRTRARSAVESLGPESGRRLTAERRGELADYLLGQQDDDEQEATRDHLAESAASRAWARVVAGDLEPMAKESLPEIPADAAVAPTRVEEEEEDVDEEVAEAPVRRPPRRRPVPAREEEEEEEEEELEEEEARPSSRLGGALLLGGLAILVAVLLIVLINDGGGDDDEPTTRQPTAPTRTQGQQQQPRVVAQVNLRGSDDAVGVAQVLIQGGQRALAIVGQELEPSTRNTAYAVWLFNSRRDARRLGFAPPVGEDGRLQGVAPLPQDASNFDELIVTQERNERSRTPGRIVLRGNLELQPEGR
jgi:hypothetical protein